MNFVLYPCHLEFLPSNLMTQVVENLTPTLFKSAESLDDSDTKMFFDERNSVVCRVRDLTIRKLKIFACNPNSIASIACVRFYFLDNDIPAT